MSYAGFRRLAGMHDDRALTESEVPTAKVGKYADNPEAFNAQLAKLMQQLKKDKLTGVAGIRQGYKGTGSKSHKRQVWTKMPGHERGGPDVWLDDGYVKVGGIIDLPKTILSTKKYGDESPEAVYQWIADTLKQLMKHQSEKYKDAPKAENMNDTINSKLDALLADLTEANTPNAYRIGTVRTWKSGKYKKTATGWVPISSMMKSVANKPKGAVKPQLVKSGGKSPVLPTAASPFGKTTSDPKTFIKTPGVVTFVPKGYKEKESGSGGKPHFGGTADHRYENGECVYCGKKKPANERIEAERPTSYSASFRRLTKLTDERVLPEAKVADMDDDEVVACARELAKKGRKAKLSPKDTKDFKMAMQRIKDEGLLGDDDQKEIWQWYGKGGQ